MAAYEDQHFDEAIARATIGQNIRTATEADLSVRGDAVIILAGLMQRLKAAERGSNEFGPYWNTHELVGALRWFYSAMHLPIDPTRGRKS